MSVGTIAVTVDLDWASESAIAELLDHLRARELPVTVFTTHRSPTVVSRMSELEVGLHPHFAPDSSHGSTIAEAVRAVLALPHNLPAFRSHRFISSNEINDAMVLAGMRISSNVCTDLGFVPPFRHRCGLLELPIFLEDGGYLFRRHPLVPPVRLSSSIEHPGPLVIVLHPMHFALNTPDFAYMVEIKRSMPRSEWNTLDERALAKLRHPGRGIRDFIVELLDSAQARGFRFASLGGIAVAHGMENLGAERGQSSVGSKRA